MPARSVYVNQQATGCASFVKYRVGVLGQPGFFVVRGGNIMSEYVNQVRFLRLVAARLFNLMIKNKIACTPAGSH